MIGDPAAEGFGTAEPFSWGPAASLSRCVGFSSFSNGCISLFQEPAVLLTAVSSFEELAALATAERISVLWGDNEIEEAS